MVVTILPVKMNNDSDPPAPKMDKDFLMCNLEYDEVFLKTIRNQRVKIYLGNKEGCTWFLEVGKDAVINYDNSLEYELFLMISGYTTHVNHDVSVVVFKQNAVQVFNIFTFRRNALQHCVGRIIWDNYGRERQTVFIKIRRETEPSPDREVQTVEIDQIKIPKSETSADENVRSVAKANLIDKLHDLSYDFQSLLNAKDSSDLTIKCNSAIFSVHKTVLCARSSVFQAMLASPMQEMATNEIVIDDIDPETFQIFLQFLYSGKTEIKSVSTADSLLYAAEKYQIRSLKGGIVEYLKSEIDIENCIQVLEIADMYDQSLKPDVIQFICDNFNEIKGKQEWKKLKQTKLALTVDVYSFLVKD